MSKYSIMRNRSQIYDLLNTDRRGKYTIAILGNGIHSHPDSGFSTLPS